MRARTILGAGVALAAFVWTTVFFGRAGEEAGITILPPTKPASPVGVISQAPPPAVSVAAAPSAAAPAAGLPVGSVVAWLKSYTNTPALPADWAECNGQVLSLAGSPYDGMPLPDLNGASSPEKRFLRGSTRSGSVGGAEAHNHGFTGIDRPSKRTINVASRNPALNLPPYYEVTWIVKVL